MPESLRKSIHSFKLLSLTLPSQETLNLPPEMERDLNATIEEIGEALLRRMERVDREIAEVKQKTRKVEQAKEAALIKTVEVEAKIAATKEMLVKVDKMIVRALSEES